MSTDDDALAKASTAETILEYLKVLTWPLVLVGVLAVYRPPVGKMVNSIAVKLENASKLTIGAFSVEVAERAREAGSADLAADIGELSAPAVAALMGVTRDGSMILMSSWDESDQKQFGLPSSTELQALSELASKELIRFEIPIAEFVAEVRGLPPGESLPGPDERTWYLAPNAAVARRLQMQAYELTDRGRTAVEAITEAVAAQLAGSS